MGVVSVAQHPRIGGPHCGVATRTAHQRPHHPSTVGPVLLCGAAWVLPSPSLLLCCRGVLGGCPAAVSCQSSQSSYLIMCCGVVVGARGHLILCVACIWHGSCHPRLSFMPEGWQLHQDLVTPLIAKMTPVHNYFVRFLAYAGASIPTFWDLPVLLGGVVLVITRLVLLCVFLPSFVFTTAHAAHGGISLIYLYAALQGESWKPVITTKKRSGPKTFLKAPSRPPPRLVHDGDAAPTAVNDVRVVAEPARPSRPAPRPRRPKWETAVDAASNDVYCALRVLLWRLVAAAPTLRSPGLRHDCPCHPHASLLLQLPASTCAPLLSLC